MKGTLQYFDIFCGLIFFQFVETPVRRDTRSLQLQPKSLVEHFAGPTGAWTIAFVRRIRSAIKKGRRKNEARKNTWRSAVCPALRTSREINICSMRCNAPSDTKRQRKRIKCSTPELGTRYFYAAGFYNRLPRMQAFAEKSRKREKIKEEKKGGMRKAGVREKGGRWRKGNRDGGGTVAVVPLPTPLRIGFLNNFSGERETG